jgi:hypothetical protein
METTHHDAAQMGRLLACAHYLLHEAEQVAQGHAVKMTLHGTARGTMSDVFPPRVAAYLRRAMGRPLLFHEDLVAVEFASHGEPAELFFLSPTGHVAVLKAWLAWQIAERRRLQRQLARAKRQKGGPWA